MRYKWIALVLACALLLCGCTPIERVESAGGSAQTTATTTKTTTQITAVKTRISTTQPPVTTTTTVTTTVQKTLCGGLPGPAPAEFSDIQAYEEALKKVNSSEALKKVLPVSQWVTDKELEQRTTMLLRDKFFLVPDLSAITENVYVSLDSDGVTYVSFPYESKPNKQYIQLWIYHYELPAPPLSAANNKEGFVNAYTTSAGLSVTENSPQERIFEVEGYYAVLTAPNDAYSDNFVDTLTFEKIEIK